MLDEIQWVTCPECGEQQANMGKGIRCESCGFGPMPTDTDHDAQEPVADSET